MFYKKIYNVKNYRAFSMFCRGGGSAHLNFADTLCKVQAAHSLTGVFVHW